MKSDIIIPVWNQLAVTTDCINSIVKHTENDYRLIIVDNASEDKTRTYLEKLSDELGSRMLLVRNKTNAGFVKAVNKAIGLSSAPYICVLNNDTLVTKDWLTEMIAIAESAADIGIVNPSSNNLGQKPQDGEPIDNFADRLHSQRGSSVELGAAIGFCMLIKRKVIERIGVFDEVYGMGNFEDTDLSRRATKQGFRCVRACGAYVYHRENTSFSKYKKFDEDFKRNREIFEFRWGKPKRVAYVLDVFDENSLKRLNNESLKLAREGNWVWYFFKNHIDMPSHSNIVAVELPRDRFHARALFRILKKKKKFSEIFVGEERFGRLLEGLSFIHKAKVGYY